jgi:hypothetical protein
MKGGVPIVVPVPTNWTLCSLPQPSIQLLKFLLTEKYSLYINYSKKVVTHGWPFIEKEFSDYRFSLFLCKAKRKIYQVVFVPYTGKN